MDAEGKGQGKVGGSVAQSTGKEFFPVSPLMLFPVAALEPCGGRAAFSNYGPGLAFSAPRITSYNVCYTKLLRLSFSRV